MSLRRACIALVAAAISCGQAQPPGKTGDVGGGAAGSSASRLESCRSDADCHLSNLPTCVNNMCSAAPAAGSGANGDPCVTDGDCRTGLVCSNGSCASGSGGGTGGGSGGGGTGGGGTGGGGTSGVDAGSGGGGGGGTCPGYAAPQDQSCCNSSSCPGGVCDPNGCWGGYYCNISTCKCHTKPAGC